MGDKPQIWDIPVTPAQRFVLLTLFFPTTTDARGQQREVPNVGDRAEGKRLRRAVRAFGIDVIRETARKTEGRLSTERCRSREPMLHKVTAENLDLMLEKIGKVPGTAAGEMEVGDLFDLLETVQASKEVPPFSAIPYCGDLTPETIPVFGAASEDWTAPAGEEDDPDEVICPSCGQSFAIDESADEKKAA